MASGANVRDAYGVSAQRIVVPVDSGSALPVRIAGYVGQFDTPPVTGAVIDYSPTPGTVRAEYVFHSDFPAGPITVFVYAPNGTFRRYVY
jgi:hypothetical protein